MDTIDTEELKVKVNYSHKSFTIRTSDGKYRTNRLSVREFHNMLKYTEQDWRYFLETEQCKKVIK